MNIRARENKPYVIDMRIGGKSVGQIVANENNLNIAILYTVDQMSVTQIFMREMPKLQKYDFILALCPDSIITRVDVKYLQFQWAAIFIADNAVISVRQNGDWLAEKLQSSAEAFVRSAGVDLRNGRPMPKIVTCTERMRNQSRGHSRTASVASTKNENREMIWKNATRASSKIFKQQTGENSEGVNSQGLLKTQSESNENNVESNQPSTSNSGIDYAESFQKIINELAKCYANTIADYEKAERNSSSKRE